MLLLLLLLLLFLLLFLLFLFSLLFFLLFLLLFLFILFLFLLDIRFRGDLGQHDAGKILVVVRTLVPGILYQHIVIGADGLIIVANAKVAVTFIVLCRLAHFLPLDLLKGSCRLLVFTGPVLRDPTPIRILESVGGFCVAAFLVQAFACLFLVFEQSGRRRAADADQSYQEQAAKQAS